MREAPESTSDGLASAEAACSSPLSAAASRSRSWSSSWVPPPTLDHAPQSAAGWAVAFASMAVLLVVDAADKHVRRGRPDRAAGR